MFASSSSTARCLGGTGASESIETGTAERDPNVPSAALSRDRRRRATTNQKPTAANAAAPKAGPSRPMPSDPSLPGRPPLPGTTAPAPAGDEADGSGGATMAGGGVAAGTADGAFGCAGAAGCAGAGCSVAAAGAGGGGVVAFGGGASVGAAVGAVVGAGVTIGGGRVAFGLCVGFALGGAPARETGGPTTGATDAETRAGATMPTIASVTMSRTANLARSAGSTSGFRANVQGRKALVGDPAVLGPPAGRRSTIQEGAVLRRCDVARVDGFERALGDRLEANSASRSTPASDSAAS